MSIFMAIQIPKRGKGNGRRGCYANSDLLLGTMSMLNKLTTKWPPSSQKPTVVCSFLFKWLEFALKGCRNGCTRGREPSFRMFFLSAAAGTMLPRNMRTGGYDLPGVESSDVPLIGYRPLSPDGGTPSNQSGSGGHSDELETSQVSVFLLSH